MHCSRSRAPLMTNYADEIEEIARKIEDDVAEVFRRTGDSKSYLHALANSVVPKLRQIAKEVRALDCEGK